MIAQIQKRLVDWRLEVRKVNRLKTPVEIMKEQFNSPCAEELAAFNRFMDLMRLDGYDATIFDTAPTGHTLRLLMLPVDWSKQLELSAVSTAQLDISTEEVKEKYKQVLDLMKNADRTTLAFVTYPEYTPIIEADRAARELGSVGLKTSLVVANYILPEEHCKNDYFRKRKEMQDRFRAEDASNALGGPVYLCQRKQMSCIRIEVAVVLDSPNNILTTVFRSSAVYCSFIGWENVTFFCAPFLSIMVYVCLPFITSP